MTSNPHTAETSAGLATMDREHSLELQIVRELQAALRSGASVSAAELAARLADFTNAHFLAEQLLMRLHAYPGYAAHQLEHDRLIAELRELQERIERNLVVDADAEAERLESWLTAHMASADHVLADYLRAPSPAPTTR